MAYRKTSACLVVACLALSWQAHAGPAAADAAAPSATGVTTLRCGMLIDGVSSAPRRDVAVHIEEGHIIAVPGDPLRDLSQLEKVSFVMLGGREIASQ